MVYIGKWMNLFVWISVPEEWLAGRDFVLVYDTIAKVAHNVT